MSVEEMRARLAAARNLPEALFAQAEASPQRPAQWVRDPQGVYRPIAYAQLAERVRRFATGLIRAGIAPGERVALLMENRPEWAVADYGIMSAGGITVPLYTTARTEEWRYVLEHSGAKMAVCSGGKLLARLREAAPELPIVAIHPEREEIPWDAFTDECDEAAVSARLKLVERGSLASLVYTSGTTGDPKGVMLSHGNFLANIEGVLGLVDIRFGEDEMLSFLPLAHAFERLAGHFLVYSLGLSVAFAERVDTVAKNLQEARPTILVTVPRLLEVMKSRIETALAQKGGLAPRLLAMQLRYARAKGLGRVLFGLADALLGRKLRARFGGRLRLIVSGGAPLSPEVGEFFDALGLPVIEGYGLTEAAPVLTVNPPKAKRFGTVGRPLVNVEIRIAEDGEILARGPNIMQGYWRNEAATKEAIDEEGFLHTGDVGVLDEGYLIITDRKKDIIVNSGGENIAPQKIEAHLAADPFIEQIVVYGDQKPYLVALVAPAREACEAWAEEEGLPRVPWEELARSKALRRMLQTRINQLLKGFPPHEQIRRIHVLAKPLSIESGLVTPTLKVKRKRVYEAFRETFEALYRE